jgi:predicted acylesterase/phospholipase RssA
MTVERRPSPARAEAGRWWLDGDRVEGYVSGVFEGGGAKGILYAGALEGLLRRKLWFSAVAGSSAGAITAAMIAAGMTPSEIGGQRKAGLAAMATPTRWSGFRRLRWGTGFLDHEGIVKWLSELLSERCGMLGLQVDEDGPSFQQLSELTGIDLFVAAVDLRARHLAVFNGTLTPRAAVAEAVMASATIPFALEPRVFQASIDGSLRWRLFVDGGVASNFPSFVFQDQAFRAYSGLGPMPAQAPVIGFLLDEARRPEQREETFDVYKRGAFIGAYFEGLSAIRTTLGSPAFKRPRFRRDPRVHWPGPLRRLGGYVRRGLSIVELVALKLVSWLGAAFQHGNPQDAFTWNWGAPKGRHGRLWVAAIRPWLAPAALPLIVGVAAYTAVFWVGFVVSVRHVAPVIGRSEIVGLIVGGALGVLACVVATWLWLLGLLTFLLALATRRAVGVLGSDVLETYMNTSAPPWAGSASNEHLVRLEIPDGIRTLRIDPGVDLEAALARAEETTFAALDAVRGAPLSALSEGD